jgi:multidrug resistance efflux pump
MPSHSEVLSLVAGEPVATIRPPAPDQVGLATLLHFEGELRRRASVNELLYHFANETRQIVGYDQMFILRQSRIGEGFHVVVASSIAVVDRNAPLIQAIEAIISAAGLGTGLDHAQDFAATERSSDPAIAEYPFTAWRWQPLVDRQGIVFAGLLFARQEAMREGEGVRTDRIAETLSHAWCALTGGKPVRKIGVLGRFGRRSIVIALIGIALFPVRLTALAPVEVVSAHPFVVSAPYAGVIGQIHVAPNASVTPGQPVLSFEDIKVRNEMAQAEERLNVARARIERASSAAFGKADEARDIATMRAEYEVAQADFNYARDLMAKSQVKAPRGGMVIYSDRRDWEGRAVNVGDPILQIADPLDVSFRIDLPTKEQLTLEPGGTIKVWLDSQPLWALKGRIETASYQARPTADGVLAFAVTAHPTGGAPRIGSRGTAKLYGHWVPLAYSLFKRPISSLRQYIGL